MRHHSSRQANYHHWTAEKHFFFFAISAVDLPEEVVFESGSWWFASAQSSRSRKVPHADDT
jgi:hypothetical protein